ncbi:hypothetical protein COLO4_06490 [Corchorus olitorius]|uniref:G-patch domain-containing protein n=1 Tax=Corchorus olitorius TaxID=93759 RepID=A0A1R3KMX9_9ROSI|nr:hypothetical protein COLO4_06490 [Corchorus olitorius]
MIRSNLPVVQKIARPKKEPTQVYVYYTRSRVRKMEEQAAEIQHLRQAQEEMRHSQEEMRQEKGVIKERLAAIMGMLQRLSGEKAPTENTQTQEQKIAVISEKDTIVVISGIEIENVSTIQTTLPTPLINPYMYPQVSDGQYTFPVASATASGTFVPHPHSGFGTSYVPPPLDYSHLYIPGVATAKPVLKKSGWKEGRGLGKDLQGITRAVNILIHDSIFGLGFKPIVEDWAEAEEKKKQRRLARMGEMWKKRRWNSHRCLKHSVQQDG